MFHARSAALHTALAAIRSVVIALTMAMLAGCAALGYRDAIEDLAAFRPLAESPQVRHAPGAEAHARRVAELLPAAIAQVEAVHYRRFRTPPVVYVCDDQACFDRYVAPGYNFAAAVVYDNRLLLAPRLFERESHRLDAILKHELSHLHLGQRLGHYSMEIPVWFHEGLAALAAGGGGADLATDAEAWSAADAGRHFLPEEHHRPWQRIRAQAWGLSTTLFYRQAYLYMRDLRERDQHAFRHLLDRVQDGEAFDAVFVQTYHANPANSVLAYFRRLECAAASNVPESERTQSERCARRPD